MNTPLNVWTWIGVGLLASTGYILAPPIATGAPTSAAGPPTELSAAVSQIRKCFAARVDGKGVDGFPVAASVSGIARVRLQPASASSIGADWDVAIFDARTGALLGASAAPRSYEVADAHVRVGQKLWVQGCRYAGHASRVKVSIAFTKAPGSDADQTAQLLSVSTPTPRARQTLDALNLNETDPSTPGSVDVVAGAADTDRLRRSGLRYHVTVADLAADAARSRQADRTYAATVSRSGLPSGRTTYRHLWDYDYEMKDLARRHPHLVRLVTLSERSYEGRDITGLEITQNASNTADGKPVFLNMGLIHAREWPAGELPMEWAYDLLNGYGHDKNTTRLLKSTRSIVVPVVNPDGFSVSREARTTSSYDFQRKNCDPAGEPTSLQTGICPYNPVGTNRGTDLNRNFGAFWGGPGASTSWQDETYRGTGPFSEPETRAVRDLVTSRQVTNLIMNHTQAGLVLYPPGLASEGTPPDAPLLSALGQRLSDHNGLPALPVYALTDATGGVDEWAYWVGGSLGMTIEIAGPGFHPTFARTVAQYLGRAPAAGAGKGGNRAAYFAMLASTATVADHARITGRAPGGWTLRLRKTFQTPTSPVLDANGNTGAARLVRNTFTSTLHAPGGRFTWAVNPSTRPLVAGRYGRNPVGPPQAAAVLTNPPGQPGVNDQAPQDGPHEVATFTVGARPAVDDGSATVTLSWSNPDTGWQFDVVDANGADVPQASTYAATSQSTTVLDPTPGAYHVIISTYAQPSGTSYDDWTGQVSYRGPTPAVPGVTEPWLLTCQRPDHSIAGLKQVIVTRGQRVDVGRVCGR